jgi:hypothetical protein
VNHDSSAEHSSPYQVWRKQDSQSASYC